MELGADSDRLQGREHGTGEQCYLQQRLKVKRERPVVKHHSALRQRTSDLCCLAAKSNWLTPLNLLFEAISPGHGYPQFATESKEYERHTLSACQHDPSLS